ncbi:MAG TPA: 3-phosphoshikimate 1-carboxyvinyltransferase [Campylobacterales bacterium]|nr:3-phosphoshikimate 1-carboxyvinyltransferase [Campylobacterales bacterium]
MSNFVVKPCDAFDIEIDTIASDKSISHRCAIFSLLSDKPSKIINYLGAEDTLNTLSIVEQLGAQIEKNGNVITITPPKTIKEPASILDCGNSGTAIRLFMGFLATREGFFVLHGDKYLASRPMKRVADPLRKIGATIDGRVKGNLAPISIRGAKLEGFDYKSPIASAQVKSAMILAALSADSSSVYSEPHLSRDHSERMLRGMGAEVIDDGGKIKILPNIEPLQPLDITVPSDPSSGFFFAVAAAITPNATIVLKNVSLNPTRIEAYEILKQMGTSVEFIEKENKYEPIGDIIVSFAPLKAVEVSKNIAWLIDELPALSIAFACADGESVVKNAHELRVKESDRISSVVENLEKCGIKTTEYEDGYTVFGGTLKSAEIDSFGDHRVAMSFAIAGLKCGMKIEDAECIQTSFPNFVMLLQKISEVKVGN